MAHEFTIRKGRTRDKEDAWNIWLQLARYNHRIDPEGFILAEDAREKFLKAFETFVRSRNKKALVGEKNGKVIGVLLGSIQRRHPFMRIRYQAYIDEIVVVEKERNKGVGTKLTENFIEWVRERNVPHIALFVFPENEPALKLYKKFGFETIVLGQRKSFKGFK
jgi:ribosomal protein S18 acetylase RimI-like enzyme